MTATALITDLELKARSIIAEAREVNWSCTQQRVLNVFVAMWSSSITAERIAQVDAALVGCEYSDKSAEAVSKVLRDLVKRKVLRARVIKGARHYELAL